jgi:hypothetical protein
MFVCRLIRDSVTANQMTAVNRVLDVLADLARSHNPHNRKGGLIGLAAAAIALGQVGKERLCVTMSLAHNFAQSF